VDRQASFFCTCQFDPRFLHPRRRAAASCLQIFNGRANRVARQQQSSTRRLAGVKHPRVRHAPTPVSVSAGTYRFFRPNSATCPVIECGSGRRVARFPLLQALQIPTPPILRRAPRSQVSQERAAGMDDTARTGSPSRSATDAISSAAQAPWPPRASHTASSPASSRLVNSFLRDTWCCSRRVII
jgi:hypothetical protein